MDEQNFKRVVKEVIEEALAPIRQKLDSNSGSLVKIEKEIGAFGDAYKENQRNIEKLDTRLNTVEKELAINPPEELKVTHFN
jgi:hypothetical protein